MKIIKKEDFKESKWAGGVTSEVFIYPKEADVSKKNFDFRISTASCELEKSAYTSYDDFYRFICPLDNKMEISVDDYKFNLSPFEILFFDGKAKTYSSGDLRDFNLIYKKGLEGDMEALNICNYKTYFKDLGLIFNYDSDLKINGEEFPKFSCLELENEEVEIKGQGKIIICRIKNKK
ncbi:HutD family protein [Peptoniphilus raoultii]|uniref:HutD family protein n=1 Tax=Peptoniphilus raoultii TaxID=1776387 RepID=UPI0008D9B2E4|nr:HutD family protein [Peptoniphilus raoultii]